MGAKEIAEEALRLAEGAMPEPGIHVCEQAHKVVQRVPTLARAYLALLPPAGAWSHDEGDVVLTHPDGSTERFYAGERAPFIVAACSRYEALGGAERDVRHDWPRWGDRWRQFAAWLAAYAAGRASVIESEDFKVVRDAARICAAHNDIEAFKVRVVAPFRSANQSAKAAAIRTALEALR